MTEDRQSSRSDLVRRILIWTLPFDLGLVALVVVLAVGWELWTGIGFVIAGAIGSVMLIGNHYRIGPDH